MTPIPPPPKVNRSAVILQKTQVLVPIAAPSAPDCRRKVLHLPHQGNKEVRRRAKQLERAKAKP